MANATSLDSEEVSVELKREAVPSVANRFVHRPLHALRTILSRLALSYRFSCELRIMLLSSPKPLDRWLSPPS
jgi:hypothetical protein